MTPNHRDEGGAAMLEFALVAIPLLLLAVGVLAFGLTLGLHQSTTHAASAAARQAITVTGEDCASRQTAIVSRVDGVVADQLSWLPSVTPTAQTTFSGCDTVTVTVDVPNPFNAIGFGPVRPPASLRSQATLDLEDL